MNPLVDRGEDTLCIMKPKLSDGKLRLAYQVGPRQKSYMLWRGAGVSKARAAFTQSYGWSWVVSDSVNHESWVIWHFLPAAENADLYFYVLPKEDKNGLIN